MGLSRGASAGAGPRNEAGTAARYLFVYGTLRRAFKNRYARYLAEHGDWMGEACISGRLYDLGRYPGLQRPRGSKDRVIGELYRLPETPDLLPLLDEYEGPDFGRALAVAHRAGRAPVKTWVYEYRPQVSEARRIVSGDYLNRTGLETYS